MSHAESSSLLSLRLEEDEDAGLFVVADRGVSAVGAGVVAGDGDGEGAGEGTSEVAASAGCGCGEAGVGVGDAGVTEGEAGAAPPFISRSISAFSSSVIIVVATEVISFMSEISPICTRLVNGYGDLCIIHGHSRSP